MKYIKIKLNYYSPEYLGFLSYLQQVFFSGTYIIRICHNFVIGNKTEIVVYYNSDSSVLCGKRMKDNYVTSEEIPGQKHCAMSSIIILDVDVDVV